MRPDQKTLERLKGEYGEVYAVEVGGVFLVVRAPTRAAFKRFVEKADASRYGAMENLLRDCVVWPEGSELDALLERKPGLVAPIAEHLVRLAGATAEADFRPL